MTISLPAWFAVFAVVDVVVCSLAAIALLISDPYRARRATSADDEAGA